MMVPANQSGENLINNFLKPNLIKQEENDVKNKAKEVVDFLNLGHLSNELAGNLKSSSGNIFFNNEEITDVPSYELFSKGLLRTFQIAHEFSNLSVLENLMMVPANQTGENLINNFLRPHLIKQEEVDVKAKAKEVVDFLNLGHLSNELAGNLSGGQKNYWNLEEL